MGVKRKLFTDDFSKKENHYTSNVVDDLDMGLNEKILEINNNPFQIEDDYCNTTEEIDYNKNTVSIKEININDDMFTTPKRKSVIVIAQKLFSSGKRSNPIEINNTPKADLNELIKNSKNVWDTDGYIETENDYKSLTVDNMNIDLIKEN